MSGFILWRGPSALDGNPIIVVVTQDSVNRKTGPMDQAWILRADAHPLQAVRTGADVSVCGDCRHRGTSCYVAIAHAPSAIYRALVADRYDDLTGDPREARLRLTARYLRIGAYGDPAAVPVTVWRPLLRRLRGWTGYTHQWRRCAPSFRQFLMASVDTQDEQREAARRGWRTFRVRTTGELLAQEMVCPASAEAGHRLTCQRCLQCSGHGNGRTRHVAIYAHGQKAATFFRNAQQALGFAT